MKVQVFLILLFPLLGSSQARFENLRKSLAEKNNYEYVYNFVNNMAVFRTFDNGMGVIDTGGQIIIDSVFSFIALNNSLKNIFEVGNEINGKFHRGYIDRNENIVIPIIYDDVYYVGHGTIRVSIGNKQGAIDTLNRVILPAVYSGITFDNNTIVAKKGNVNELYDYKGKKLTNLEFSAISRFHESKSIVTFKNGSNGIIDTLGNIIMNPIKDHSYQEVFANSHYSIKNNLDNKIGVVNSDGEFVIECKYDEIKQEKIYLKVKMNGKEGLISWTDSIIIPIIFDDIMSIIYYDSIGFGIKHISDNFKVQKEKLLGVLNPTLEEYVIPMEYKKIEPIFDRYLVVQNIGNLYGLFSVEGKSILSEVYTFYNFFENRIFASKENKQLMISLKEDTFIEIELPVDEFVAHCSERILPVSPYQIFKSEEKYGLINYEGNVIIPCEYEFMKNTYDSKEFIVQKNNKYGLVNSENIILVEIEYDDFVQQKRLLFTKNDGKIKKYHN